MRFFCFSHKVVGAESGAMEQWLHLASAEIPPPFADLDEPAVTVAIRDMTTWGDELLADHRGHHELFDLCTASMTEDGAPDVVLAEEYRVLIEGTRVKTAGVMDVRAGSRAAGD